MVYQRPRRTLAIARRRLENFERHVGATGRATDTEMALHESLRDVIRDVVEKGKR